MIVFYKKEFGEKMWRLRGSKFYFWQGAILAGTAGTFLIMYFLNCSNILVF